MTITRAGKAEALVQSNADGLVENCRVKTVKCGAGNGSRVQLPAPDSHKCPKCGSATDRYEGVSTRDWKPVYRAIEVCDICGHIVYERHDGGHEEKVKP